MSSTLIGKHNPRLAEIRKAFRQGSLTPDGLLPIEGNLLIQEARVSGLRIAEVFVREQDSGEAQVSDLAEATYVVPDAVIDSIAGTEQPQGLVALVSPPQFDLDAMLNVEGTPSPLLVVLCGVQDPGNAGTILRLGEAFGATGCIATSGTAGQYNAKLVRASAGSLFRLPHVWDVDLDDLGQRAHSAGIQLIGTDPTGAAELESPDWSGPTLIMIGNEAAGLGSAETSMCDALVRIPHSANVESLNAATAAAIVLYEADRQRRKGRKGKS
jgi:TrmH family RNA methyltransferase